MTVLCSLISKLPLYSNKILNRTLFNRVQFHTSIKQYSANIFNTNTNIIKDVILYKYENPRHFFYLSVFSAVQLGFWTFLSHVSYKTLRDVPVRNVKENDPLWKKINLGEKKYRTIIAVTCFVFGSSFVLGALAYTMRSVRYLVLRKGGQNLSFVTYGPFGKNLVMDVPVREVSAKESRASARVVLPIKIKGRLLHYMLDMRGEFRNKALFDTTAGLKRNFKV